MAAGVIRPWASVFRRGVWAAIAIALASSAPLRATTINILPISSALGHIGDGTPTNNLALGALDRAAQVWESILSDNIIMNFRVDFTALGSGILADASPSLVATTYSSFLAQVDNHLVSSPNALLDNLPTGTVPLSLPLGFTWTNNITMTTANAKVLGFTGGPLSNSCNAAIGPCDGTMRFGNAFNWDFDRSDGITAGFFDLEGVAIHEIGHALGFYSEVDTIDYMLQNNQTGAVNISVLDLYRFADCQSNPSCPVAEPTTLGQFSTATRYMNTAAATVFSTIDQRWEMSRGYYKGDGNQASHWKNISPSIGVMNPTLAPGIAPEITAADIRAMQALGYSVNTVPEPGPLVMMSSGCIAIFLLRRRPA